MPNIMPRLLAATLALLAGVSAEAAAAAEVNVLCSGALRGVLQQLAPDFEKSSGRHLVIEYGRTRRASASLQLEHRAAARPTVRS
jgi:ABC-type molybdate transport system substrate-binding protein